MEEKKVVLVTGSSRGLGKETIIQFAKHNYNVVINYNHSEKEAKVLKEEIEQKHQVKALMIKCDVSKEKEVKKMVDKVINNFKKIDVLVNNAGIAIDTLLMDKNAKDFKRVLEVNLIGSFLVSKYVGNYMLEEKKGIIINVSSTNGIDTYYPESVDYDVSKAGIISLTHNLALQLAPYIRVNCVASGWINTDMSKELSSDFVNNENKKILLNRFANPDEVAKVIYFLASDDASYINNAIIRVDGGYKNGQ